MPELWEVTLGRFAATTSARLVRSNSCGIPGKAVTGQEFTTRTRRAHAITGAPPRQNFHKMGSTFSNTPAAICRACSGSTHNGRWTCAVSAQPELNRQPPSIRCSYEAEVDSWRPVRSHDVTGDRTSCEAGSRHREGRRMFSLFLVQDPGQGTARRRIRVW